MAITDQLNLEACSLGFGAQDVDLITEPNDYTWIDAHDISITPEAPVAQAARTLQSRGAAPRNSTGRVWYRLAFKTHLHGQLTGYDPTAAGPGLVRSLGLLEDVFDEVDVGYHATGVGPATPDTAHTLRMTPTPKLGTLVAFGDSGGTRVAAMGFVKSYTGSGAPYAVRLFEDMAVKPTNNAKLWPTKTLVQAGGIVPPKGFCLRGEPTSQDWRLNGAFPVSCVKRMDEAGNWIAEWEWMIYGGMSRDAGGSGGLQPINAMQSLPPMTGAGGRVVLGADVFSTLDDGTEGAGSCDVRDIVITHSWVPRPVTLDGYGEGVVDVMLWTPRTSVSFTIPEVTDYEIATVNAFQAAFREQTTVAFSLYCGDRPGRCLAFQMRKGQVTSFPNFPTVDRGMGRAVTLEAIDNIESADTDAGSRPSVLAIA